MPTRRRRDQIGTLPDQETEFLQLEVETPNGVFVRTIRVSFAPGTSSVPSGSIELDIAQDTISRTSFIGPPMVPWVARAQRTMTSERGRLDAAFNRLCGPGFHRLWRTDGRCPDTQ